MNNLYLIGGSPRSGKTIIFNSVINKRPMVAISSDALREGARFALTGESFANISDLSFDGDVSFHRTGDGTGVSYTKHFSQRVSDDELTWNVVCGLINFYDKKDIPVIIEGMVITPERVKSLDLKNLKIKAAFVGFTDNLQLKSMLEYAHVNKDWIYKEIIDGDKEDESSVKKWYDEEKENNKHVAFDARRYGYGFFSPNESSFQEYCDKVIKYLLE